MSTCEDDELVEVPDEQRDACGHEVHVLEGVQDDEGFEALVVLLNAFGYLQTVVQDVLGGRDSQLTQAAADLLSSGYLFAVGIELRREEDCLFVAARMAAAQRAGLVRVAEVLAAFERFEEVFAAGPRRISAAVDVVDFDEPCGLVLVVCGLLALDALQLLDLQHQVFEGFVQRSRVSRLVGRTHLYIA